MYQLPELVPVRSGVISLCFVLYGVCAMLCVILRCPFYTCLLSDVEKTIPRIFGCKNHILIEDLLLRWGNHRGCFIISMVLISLLLIFSVRSEDGCVID